MFEHTGLREARPRGRQRRRGLLLAMLLLGLAVQVSVVAKRDFLVDDSPDALDPLEHSARLAVGDTVRSLAGRVVYAFSLECEHSEALAPAWAEHFVKVAAAASSFRRTVVTSDDPETAVRYSKRYGWDVEVLGTAELALEGRELSLVDRTPWLFVFDSAGVLQYEGHGAELDRLEKVLGEHRGMRRTRGTVLVATSWPKSYIRRQMRSETQGPTEQGGSEL